MQPDGCISSNLCNTQLMKTYVKKLRIGSGYALMLLLITVICNINCQRSTLLMFEDFDADDDNKISKKEFTNAFTATFFEKWDSDKDNRLSDADFIKVSFHMWDINKDSRLTIGEWNHGYDNFYKMAGHASYEEINSDHDSIVTFNEFSRIFKGEAIFVVWDFDRDNYLDVKEFASGIFTNWDLDRNDTLDRKEYRKFEHEYLDI